MSKKILSLALTCALLLALAACGSNGKDVQGSVTPNSAVSSAVDSQPEDSSEPASQPEDSSQPEESSNVELELGTVTSNHYENSFIGIGCDFGSEWTFKTDEEIRELNESVLGMLDEEYAEAVQKANNVYDMYATHENGTDTVNIIFQKLSGAQLLISESDYAEASKDSVGDALESMGMTGITIETGTQDFAGEEHTNITVEGEYSGIKVYERMVCLKRKGYIVNVTVCTWQTDSTQDVLDQFYTV